MKNTIIVLLSFAFLINPVFACPIVRRAVIVNRNRVVVDEVVPIVIPAVVTIPLFSVSPGYVPVAPAPTQVPTTPTVDPALDAALNKLRQQIADLENKLNGQRPAPQPDPVPVQPVPPVNKEPDKPIGSPTQTLSLLQTKCFSCHSGAKVEGNLNLGGGLGSLSGAQLAALRERTKDPGAKGAMPPAKVQDKNPPLSDQEWSDLSEAVTAELFKRVR